MQGMKRRIGTLAALLCSLAMMLCVAVSAVPARADDAAVSPGIEALKDVKAVEYDGKPVQGFDYRENHGDFYSSDPSKVELKNLPEGYYVDHSSFIGGCAGLCYMNFYTFEVKDADGKRRASRFLSA